MGGYSRERKHLRFLKQERPVGKKTDTWKVVNGEGHYLGLIIYRPGWRRYVFRYHTDAVIDFDANCFEQAAEFLREETAKLKATWKKRK